MIGKSVRSVPAFKYLSDFVCLIVVAFDRLVELVVHKAGAAHGALCCPVHELDVLTPTDTTATKVHGFGLVSGEREVAVIACGSPKSSTPQQTVRRRNQDDDGDEQGEARLTSMIAAPCIRDRIQTICHVNSD